MIRLSILLLTFVFFTTISCKKDNDSSRVCGVTDPMNNLEWLRRAVDSLEAANQPGQVLLLQRNGTDYINIQLMIQSCMLCAIRTCDGNRLEYARDSALIKSLQTEEFTVLATFGL